MIQLTAHMRILVAIEPADFRKGIDGLARVCFCPIIYLSVVRQDR